MLYVLGQFREVLKREAMLNAIARDQRGLFTLAQAEACGFARRTVTGRAARGLYEQVYPTVYGLAGSEATWHREVVAAVLSGTPPSAASHLTAAFLWNLTDQRPRRIEIVTLRHLRVKRLPFAVHESKDLIEDDIHFVDGIPTTSPARTLVDLGASAKLGPVARCLDTALRTKLVTLEEIDQLLRRVARRGRTGVATIRPLVQERLRWQSVTDSTLEDRFRAIVHKARLPVPVSQYDLHSDKGMFIGRFDFAYEGHMMLVELDSERYHMDPDSFQRDREKQTNAQLLGWTVYRFTWRDLTERADVVTSVLASILAK
jgi:predicted transcriptional regulator of viral defense system